MITTKTRFVIHAKPLHDHRVLHNCSEQLKRTTRTDNYNSLFVAIGLQQVSRRCATRREMNVIMLFVRRRSLSCTYGHKVALFAFPPFRVIIRPSRPRTCYIMRYPFTRLYYNSALSAHND